MKTKQPQPIDRLKVHHVGIATNNLDRLTDEYLKRGYRIINEVYDTKQKARLRLLSKDNQYNIELIYTKDPKSRVFNLSQKRISYMF